MASEVVSDGSDGSGVRPIDLASRLPLGKGKVAGCAVARAGDQGSLDQAQLHAMLLVGRTLVLRKHPSQPKKLPTQVAYLLLATGWQAAKLRHPSHASQSAAILHLFQLCTKPVSLAHRFLRLNGN